MHRKRVALFLLVIFAMSLGLPVAGSETLNTSLASAQAYIDALTIDSTANVPGTVVPDTAKFFSWDNERRAPPAKPYLYEWSYYNGVVFEGSRYVNAATGVADYSDYADAYLDAMVTGGALNSYAGYVSTHGLDCYKTASLLLDFVDFSDPGYTSNEYYQVAATLYNDLTVTNATYSKSELGYNYWHTWISGAAPTYKVWLDGLYMGQPFMAEYAYHTGDTAQLDKVATRLDWVHDYMRNSSTGLYYHAANGSTGSYATTHWLRAIGWYAMAQVDVMPYMSGANLALLEANFQDFVDGMLPYQDAATGMWKNVVDQAASDGNRLETSGTAMMSYAILKAVRNGWLADPDGTYVDAALRAFEGIVNNKLKNSNTNLTDIYFKGSTSGPYTDPSYYYTNEGKGVGPFIMAYAEALQANTTVALTDLSAAVEAGATDATLAWLHRPEDPYYEVWRGSAPYFDPAAGEGNQVAEIECESCLSGAAVSYTDDGADGYYAEPDDPQLPAVQVIGDVTTNYFWVVRGRSGGHVSGNSNRVGEFDFALAPGSGDR